MNRPSANRAAPEPRIYNYLRWSSAAQSEGDSERRQTDSTQRVARELAEARGLPIDSELDLSDRGLSGFHEEHVARGALGGFLKLVEQGEIAPGSVLVVDSMSRLTRGRPRRAMRRLEDLVEAGIRIVTADDGAEYTDDNLDQLEYLITSTLKAYLAHDESRVKARLSREAWSAKQERAAPPAERRELLSAHVPAWLDVIRDERGRAVSFQPKEEAVAAIFRMFDLAFAGYGGDKIAATLNEEGWWAPDRPSRKTSGWHRSTVRRYLTNPALHGELTPRTGRNAGGKKYRDAAGEPIDDYYPAVVARDTVRRMQHKMDQRRRQDGNAGGRIGDEPSLLNRVATCAHCGSMMSPDNKGRGRSYLVCSAARRNAGCVRYRVRLDQIERQLLDRCRRGLDTSDLLDDQAQRSELARLQQERDAREADREDAETSRDNLIDRLKRSPDSVIADQLQQQAEAEASRAQDLAKQVESLDAEIETLVGAPQELEEGLATVRSIAAHMDELTGSERRDFRLRLREALQQIIASMEVDAEAGVAWVQLGSKAASRQRAAGKPFARTRFKLTWPAPHTRGQSGKMRDR